MQLFLLLDGDLEGGMAVRQRPTTNDATWVGVVRSPPGSDPDLRFSVFVKKESNWEGATISNETLWKAIHEKEEENDSRPAER